MQWKCWLMVLAGLLLLAACATAPALPESLPVTAQRTVDLSHVVRQDAPNLPAEPLTRLDRGPDGRLQSLTLGARTGTLLEVIAAPAASITVDALSPRDLVLDAVVIDMRDVAQDVPGYQFDVADLLAWEQQHGVVPAGSLVLLVTGWDVRWGDAEAYLALDEHGGSQAPTFSAAAVELLLTTRSVAGLGVDAPGAPDVAPTDHWLLLVNLTNLEQLPPFGATVVIGALKVQSGDRSPARVLALIP